MMCRKNDDQVEFHKVHRYGFQGELNDPTPVVLTGPAPTAPPTDKK